MSQKQKICSRGHRYRGSGPCPVCWPGHKKNQASSSRDVDAYIAAAPKEVRSRLIELRRVIKRIAPHATESIGYRMPYYSYKGRLVWFSCMKTYVGLYLRPPVIADHQWEPARYKAAKLAIHFPNDQPLPVALIKKLIKSRIMKNEEDANNKK